MTVIRNRALAAAVVGFAGLVAYVVIILSQGDTALSMWVPWALVMLLASCAAAVAAFAAQRSVARPALVFSTVIFVILGVLGALTIGLVFLLAAGFTIAELMRRDPTAS